DRPGRGLLRRIANMRSVSRPLGRPVTLPSTPYPLAISRHPGAPTPMITGELRNQIDRIWDAFWSGGISNPLEVMEQITYLLFLRRLDDLQTLEENKSARLGRPIERRIFPEGNDPRGKPYAQLRWSRFKHAEAREMFTVVGEHVFPFLRTLGGGDSTYAHHMKDARFTIPTPALLAKV